MQKGISVYFGLENSLSDNIEYMKSAKSLGFDRVFTSLHIPEADYKVLAKDIKIFLEEAKKLNMIVSCDISNNAFEFLEIEKNNLASFKEMGVEILRLDFGFSEEEVAAFSNNDIGIKIELNASTLTKKYLKKLDKHNPNYDNIIACHNYYPRNNTGISEESLVIKNEIIQDLGIEVSAFIPSLINKRGPVYEGLPTLEMHRNEKPYNSARHLFALGCDNVYFGDAIAGYDELKSVGSIKSSVELRADLFTINEEVLDLINNNILTDRSDSACDVVRAVEGRFNLKSVIEPENNNIERKEGAITVDNKKYLRYMCELQICRKDLPKDDRINVIGQIIDEDLFLIKYISDDVKFDIIKNNR
ncbi:DUF871 domain-containing protein [Romboutsia weinsteinii]|uniref:DUF871 domain-containing protein n=1 Tax=Romboutsia weinsteinii TaxID=2020949 RepID=A0A371J8W1_9FIRM|nr:MupG family TIM beta-alpha barrel fold protein [Romboutsia weinsteinii]RDY29174.1 DUF871 domain-containing protein [Romboutsia weinsteinii]